MTAQASHLGILPSPGLLLPCRPAPPPSLPPLPPATGAMVLLPFKPETNYAASVMIFGGGVRLS